MGYQAGWWPTYEIGDAKPKGMGSHMEQGYCVKCREKREIKDPQKVTTENGRSAIQGTCPVCGTKIFRFTKG